MVVVVVVVVARPLFFDSIRFDAAAAAAAAAAAFVHSFVRSFVVMVSFNRQRTLLPIDDRAADDDGLKNSL